jgi:hypothetical protein
LPSPQGRIEPNLKGGAAHGSTAIFTPKLIKFLSDNDEQFDTLLWSGNRNGG